MLSYPTMVDASSTEYTNSGAFTPVSTELSMSFPGSVSSKPNDYFTKPSNKVDYMNNNATVDTNSSISSTTSEHGADNNFLIHKGSENSKRFSVNNLLQLANCTGTKLGGEFINFLFY